MTERRPRRPTEQRAQHDPLRVPGVLVLVEQHRAGTPRARRAPTSWWRLGEPRGERHLVGEVERSARRACARANALTSGRSAAGTVARRPCRPAPPAAPPAGPWRAGRPRPRGRSARRACASVLGVDEVLAELAGQRRAASAVTVAGTRSVSRSSAQVDTTRCASCQRRGLREQPRAGLDRQPQAVLGDAGARRRRGRSRRSARRRRPPARRSPLGSSSSSRLEPASRRSRRRTRSASCRAALRVNVRPSTCSGGPARWRRATPRARPWSRSCPRRPRHDQRRLGGRGDDRRLLVGRRRQAEASASSAGSSSRCRRFYRAAAIVVTATCRPRDVHRAAGANRAARAVRSFSRRHEPGPRWPAAAALTRPRHARLEAPRPAASWVRSFALPARPSRQVHQPRATGLRRPGRSLGERAERGGELVDGELRVLLRGGVR